MKKYLERTVGPFLVMVLFLGIAALIFITRGPEATASESRGPVQYSGSASCRECHEKFYQLWSTSRHGLARQPYTEDFARARLTPQHSPVVIGKLKYRADVVRGLVTEAGPQGTTKYRIEQVLGGKNVYYFLTPLKRGRLQTLPVAYDVNRKAWFDTAASGVRHFPGRDRERPVHWKEFPYTFNTSCYGCHVSQLSTNYHFKTDTYKTTWAEPGINCETCHGSSVEHNRVMKEAPQGQPPKDMKIISVKKFTVEQHNSACSTCHLKGTPLTTTFTPGDRLFDHFDLVTLENPDYYPDGRDLGENYTYTSWLMSPCVKSGKLSCIKCHTSSGRYRFKAEEKANEACLPCHENKVKDPTAHTRHKPDSPGNKCVSCHLPLTSFARMNRSDHSMRPPTPAASLVGYPRERLKGEEAQRLEKATQEYLAFIRARPDQWTAHYNLGVLLSRDRPEEAIGFCRKAAELQPEEPRYSFTLAYYLYKKGENRQAASLLDQVLEKHPTYRDAQMLKREISGSKTKPGNR